MKPSTHTSKEVLPTQGEWKFKVLPESTHIYVYSEAHGAICSIPADSKHFEEHKANAELIVKAVNERQKLLEDNDRYKREMIMNRERAALLSIEYRELKAAFIDLYNFVQGAEMKQTPEMYQAIDKAKTAINNAKNLQS